MLTPRSHSATADAEGVMKRVPGHSRYMSDLEAVKLTAWTVPDTILKEISTGLVENVEGSCLSYTWPKLWLGILMQEW